MKELKHKIVNFIRQKVKDAKASGAVIGLSGGIDSSLTAYLTVEALGARNVMGILMPVKSLTPKQDIKDAMKIIHFLGIDHRKIEISDISQSFASKIPDFQIVKQPNGNLLARIRMCILYYYANTMNRMVVGTGNRTELLLGYYTKYGDGGVDIEPIGGLFKTQVRDLSRYMALPKSIIEKVPTAGLWPGQTDEGDIGITYEEADKILTMMVDGGHEIPKIKEKYPASHVDRIVDMMKSNEHKRTQVPSTKS